MHHSVLRVCSGRCRPLPVLLANPARLATSATMAATADRTSVGPQQKQQQQKQEADDPTASLRAVRVTSTIRAYLKNAEKHDKFIKSERENFELGKRFLAGIMGVPVAELTQENIQRAVNYLLPSGLTHFTAKPHMSRPEDVFPKKKALQCDYSGRPNHFMFYTKQPNFYQILSEIAWKVEQLKQQEDSHLRSRQMVPRYSSLDLTRSVWLTKKQFEATLLETLSDGQYKQMISALEFLASMPLSAMEQEFIMSYRKDFAATVTEIPLPELQFDSATKRHFSEAYAQKKWSTASCRVYSPGSGKFTVNGESLLEAFPLLADRENLASPLVVTGAMGKVDIEATVTVASAQEPKGRRRVRVRVDDVLYMASQAGALRLAVARALSCHLPSQSLRTKLRMSGLLTPDMRLPERKYYGQNGPRDRYTWKAR